MKVLLLVQDTLCEGWKPILIVHMLA